MKKTVSIPTKAKTADEWVGVESSSELRPTVHTRTDPREKMKRFTIDLPVSLHKKFKAFCVANDTNMADEIRSFIEKRISV